MDAAGVREPSVLRFVPDAVEALIALGRVEEARQLLARYEKQARRLDRASALAASARCAGLLLAQAGDDRAAVESFAQALRAHSRVPMPFERARTLLAHGVVERRAKRKRSAREILVAARAEFDRLGAALWRDRASAEIARISGRSRSGAKLTPTEERVAALVAEGLATKEVAAALFVSPKTVEGHLSKIYGKLGVRSRAELARTFSPIRSQS
jgi:DNA-binding CsgD family transcriptional regulator